MLARFRNRYLYEATVIRVPEVGECSTQQLHPNSPYRVLFLHPDHTTCRAESSFSLIELVQPFVLPPAPVGLTPTMWKDHVSKNALTINQHDIVLAKSGRRSQFYAPAKVMSDRGASKRTEVSCRVRFLHDGCEATHIRRKDMLPMFEDYPLVLDSEKNPVYPAILRDPTVAPDYTHRLRKPNGEKRGYYTGDRSKVDPRADCMCTLCGLDLDRDSETELSTKICEGCQGEIDDEAAMEQEAANGEEAGSAVGLNDDAEVGSIGQGGEDVVDSIETADGAELTA